MGVYEELRRMKTEIADLERVIREKHARRARLYSLLTGGTAPIGGAPARGSGSSTEDKLVNLAALSEEIDGAVDRLAGLQQQAEALCNRAEPGPGRRVLVMRYVDRKGWNEIRRTLHYSERAVFYLHAEAIRQIERQMGSG